MARLDETKSKVCSDCGQLKLPSEFPKGKQRKDGTSGLKRCCKKCHNLRVRAFLKRNPGKSAAYDKKYYNTHRKINFEDRLTAILYNSRRLAAIQGIQPCVASKKELIAAFTGKCHICGVPEDECQKRLAMDHDHTTREFRGWLCESCNKAIGFLRDSEKIAENLVVYLKRSALKKLDQEQKLTMQHISLCERFIENS